MEQIRRCAELICDHQQEITQEQIAQFHTHHYQFLAKTQQPQTHNSKINTKISFANTYSLNSCQPNSLENEHPKYKQSFNYHNSYIKDPIKEGFNKKINEKTSITQNANIAPQSPKARFMNSPSQRQGMLHAASNQYCAQSPQISKKKSLKNSAASKIVNQQLNIQRKASSKSSAFSTIQSDTKTKQKRETFYHICYINRIDQKNMQNRRRIQEYNQLNFANQEQLVKIPQNTIIHSQQFSKNTALPTSIFPQNSKSICRYLQNTEGVRPQFFSAKCLSPRFYSSADKTAQIRKIIKEKHKQSSQILSDSSVTAKTLIESLKQQQFLMGKINSNQNGNHELNLKLGDISLPINKQLKDLKTVRSICSSRLQKSCVDLNYFQNLRGVVTRLL